MRAGLISTNPVKDVRLPMSASRPHTIWTWEQARHFLEYCGNDGMATLFRLALLAGMRRGELLGLRWNYINVQQGELLVTSSRVPVGGKVVETTPKSRHGVRRIYLDKQMRSELLASADHRGAHLEGHEGLVFVDSTGIPFQPWHVSREFDRRVRELGLPRIRFHDLRHTSATLGLEAGESLKEVSSRLGHADIAITANVYGDVLPETARASAQRRATLLGLSEESALRVVGE